MAPSFKGNGGTISREVILTWTHFCHQRLPLKEGEILALKSSAQFCKDSDAALPVCKSCLYLEYGNKVLEVYPCTVKVFLNVMDELTGALHN